MNSLREFFSDALLFDVTLNVNAIKNNLEAASKITNQRIEKLQKELENSLTNLNTLLVLYQFVWVT